MSVLMIYLNVPSQCLHGLDAVCHGALTFITNLRGHVLGLDGGLCPPVDFGAGIYSFTKLFLEFSQTYILLTKNLRSLWNQLGPGPNLEDLDSLYEFIHIWAADVAVEDSPPQANQTFSNSVPPLHKKKLSDWRSAKEWQTLV